MRYKVAGDARPQVMLLLAATVVTVALWFIPYASYLVYPIRLFVTFIHESSHAVVAFLTGGSVQSLTIAADGSGVVYSVPSGAFGAVFTSSAGYLGSTIFGVILLFAMRRQMRSQKILFFSGALIALVTIVFGIISPIFHIFSLNVGFSSIGFTIAAGAVISAILFGLALYGSDKVANFAVAFIAVQCLLNAISDLKTVLLINSPLGGAEVQNDASNMANATGIPAFVWVVIWIAISAVVIFLGVRMYASVRSVSSGDDSLFNDQ